MGREMMRRWAGKSQESVYKGGDERRGALDGIFRFRLHHDGVTRVLSWHHGNHTTQHPSLGLDLYAFICFISGMICSATEPTAADEMARIGSHIQPARALIHRQGKHNGRAAWHYGNRLPFPYFTPAAAAACPTRAAHAERDDLSLGYMGCMV